MASLGAILLESSYVMFASDGGSGIHEKPTFTFSVTLRKAIRSAPRPGALPIRIDVTSNDVKVRCYALGCLQFLRDAAASIE